MDNLKTNTDFFGSSKKNDITTSKRNSNIDLLRILSMIMIIFLHLCSHGQLNRFFDISAMGIVLKCLHIVSLTSVNIFVFISGYYLVESKFKISKLLILFLEVLLYSVGIFLFMLFIKKESFTLKDYLMVFLPISYNEYWFISSYFGLYLLTPFLNMLINKVKKKEHFALIVVLFTINTVFRDLLPLSDPFLVNRGYSLVWFINLYFISSYIKKYLDCSKIKMPFLKFVIICLIGLMVWVCLKFLSQRISFINDYSLDTYWLRYNSIIVLLASFYLFVSFLKIKQFFNKPLSKIIGIVSALSLGTYLIQDNPFFRNYLWITILRTPTLEENALLIPKALLLVLLVFLSCCLIDAIRFCLFSLIQKSSLVKKAVGILDNCFISQFQESD